ncbi:MAG: ATP-binding protein [Euryarchaeota archaeon]|nr:ATP-binding protein [Euryarchaeota archaeon]
MIPQFVDRERELQFLEEIYAEKGFKMVAIYGRRRVGKTELIKRFIKDKKGAYVLLTNESLRENIKYIKEALSEALNEEYIAKLDVDSLYDLFHLIKFGNERFVLVLDEFPYLMDIKPSLLTSFQKIVDDILSKTNILLIISGSSLSMMENDVLGYRSPLYGRNVNSWKLQPFDFPTIYFMFKDIHTAMETYFVFGGIPYYLTMYDPSLSLKDNIKRKVLTKGRELYEEPLILLREEFRESRTYRLILKYISLGYQSVGKLSNATGMDKSNLSKYLDTLKETEFVEHILPFGKKRGGIYRIKDPFFDFWFRFVYPHRGDLEIGNIDKVMAIIERDINTYFGRRFEILIHELMRIGLFPELKTFKNPKMWWHKDVEIDIVASTGDTLLLGECKWSDNVDPVKIVNSLKRKGETMKLHGKIKYAVFAKSFSRKCRDAYCYDLRDIEKMIIRK